jgi:hypothetical protein
MATTPDLVLGDLDIAIVAKAVEWSLFIFAKNGDQDAIYLLRQQG